jgi:dienelactone hydrolase
MACWLFAALAFVLCPSELPAYSFKAFVPLPDGGRLPAYFFLPDHGARNPLPAVIVGVGVGSTKILQYHDHCQNLANRDFVVVLIDPSNFPEELAPGPYDWDRGGGWVIGSLNQGVVAARLAFTSEWYLKSIKAVVDYLVCWPLVDPHRIALSGHSQPANAALTYASKDPRIKAVIWNYGGSPWVMPYDPMRLPPVQIFHGEDDDVYDVKYAKKLAWELKTHMRPYELNIYPHQKHMFNVFYDLRTENRYMKPVILESFERLVGFLCRTLNVPARPVPHSRRTANR